MSTLETCRGFSPAGARVVELWEDVLRLAASIDDFTQRIQARATTVEQLQNCSLAAAEVYELMVQRAVELRAAIRVVRAEAPPEEIEAYLAELEAGAERMCRGLKVVALMARMEPGSTPQGPPS